MKIVLTILSLTIFLSCMPNVRPDYNWEQYKNCEIISEAIVPEGIDQAWLAIKKAGEQFGVKQVIEDKKSGLITYTINDGRWENVSLHFNILAIPKSSTKTKLYLRGFFYSKRFRALNDIKIFPSDGVFEERYLNAIYEQLPKSDNYKHKALQIVSLDQDSINVKDVRKNENDRYRIGILPWNIGYESGKENVISKIATYVTNSEDFEIIASYYDLPLKRKNNVKMIKNIGEDDIWIRSSIMGDKLPNIGQVCRIGKEIDADTIMVASFKSGLRWQNAFKNLRIYLIDVKSGKQCVFHSREGLSVAELNQNIFEILDNVFSDYRHLRRDVAY